MNAMQILTQGIHDCPCGKDHTCPIDAIEIGPRALEKLPALCAPYQHILLVADTNTWRVCGETASRQIAPKIDRNVILQNNTDVVVPNEEKIAEIEACLTDATDLIEKAIDDGLKVVTSPVNGSWVDIGSPGDFATARQLMKHHKNFNHSL